METTVASTLTVDEEFDLVIGDLEQSLPADSAAPTAGTCARIYCSPYL
ncbi:hypothetical protein ACFYS8_15930 [Kitasatospora sp. NPDC004615]